MQELSNRGASGRLAMLLLRAHRNCKRMHAYDDERYLRLLAARRDYAISELKEHLSIGDERRTKFSVSINFPPIPPSSSVARFWQHGQKGWDSSERNEKIIVRFCDAVMMAEEGTK